MRDPELSRSDRWTLRATCLLAGIAGMWYLHQARGETAGFSTLRSLLGTIFDLPTGVLFGVVTHRILCREGLAPFPRLLLGGLVGAGCGLALGILAVNYFRLPVPHWTPGFLLTTYPAAGALGVSFGLGLFPVTRRISEALDRPERHHLL